MPTLVLAFEGPVQAWGSGSKFDNRNTENFPTKSGVIGMIGAAMGRKRWESVEDLNELELTIRIDQSGQRFSDMQTMKIPTQKNSYVGQKFYLADAKFLVCLTHADKEFLIRIQNALNNPHYPISLGRRNCVPSGQLVKEIVDMDGEETARQYPWIASGWYKKKYKKYSGRDGLIILKEGNEGFRQIRLKDRPVSFDRNNRQYRTRVFSEVEPKVISETDSTEEVDFFEEIKNVSE